MTLKISCKKNDLKIVRDDFKKKTVKLVTLSKKGGRGQEKGKI